MCDIKNMKKPNASNKTSMPAGEETSPVQSFGTPYDNAYRTLIDKCPQLILPLINEIFGEHYTGRERIEQSPNEFFIISDNDRKIVTDSVFTIYGSCIGHYHIECQCDPDGTILIRMFQYDSQIAVRNACMKENILSVRFPNSAIIYLRNTSKTPDVSTIRIETPGGSVNYEVKSLKVREYSIEEIFEKDLLMLIPFHIFRYENRLKKIEGDEKAISEIKEHYADIISRLDKLTEDKRINEYERSMIIEMSNLVVESLTQKYEQVRKGLGEVMGGIVLETMSTKALEQGRKEGLKEGLKEGHKAGLEEGLEAQAIETARAMLADGFDIEKIVKYTGLSIEKIKSIENAVSSTPDA